MKSDVRAAEMHRLFHGLMGSASSARGISPLGLGALVLPGFDAKPRRYEICPNEVGTRERQDRPTENESIENDAGE
jgi:hypothetical protein